MWEGRVEPSRHFAASVQTNELANASGALASLSLLFISFFFFFFAVTGEMWQCQIPSSPVSLQPPRATGLT